MKILHITTDPLLGVPGSVVMVIGMTLGKSHEWEKPVFIAVI